VIIPRIASFTTGFISFSNKLILYLSSKLSNLADGCPLIGEIIIKIKNEICKRTKKRRVKTRYKYYKE
jgi:hypothetical protein